MAGSRTYRMMLLWFWKLRHWLSRLVSIAPPSRRSDRMKSPEAPDTVINSQRRLLADLIQYEPLIIPAARIALRPLTFDVRSQTLFSSLRFALAAITFQAFALAWFRATFQRVCEANVSKDACETSSSGHDFFVEVLRRVAPKLSSAEVEAFEPLMAFFAALSVLWFWAACMYGSYLFSKKFCPAWLRRWVVLPGRVSADANFGNSLAIVSHAVGVVELYGGALSLVAVAQLYLPKPPTVISHFYLCAVIYFLSLALFGAPWWLRRVYGIRYPAAYLSFYSPMFVLYFIMLLTLWLPQQF